MGRSAGGAARAVGVARAGGTNTTILLSYRCHMSAAHLSATYYLYIQTYI